MRKSLIALVAASALFLGACGASGGESDGASDEPTTTAAPKEETTTTAEETTTTEAESDLTDVDEWATSFCGAFDTWLTDIETASDNVGTPADVEGAKTALTDLFGAASTSTQTLVGELESAGAPDIEDGEDFLAELIERFDAFDEAALTAKSEIEQLSTDDPQAFAAEAETLATTFQDEIGTVSDSFEELDAKYPSPELNDAVNATCTF